MNSIIILVALALLYGLLRLVELRLCRRDPAEPPFVRARVPVVGHLLGLLRHGVSYYRMLREKTPLPILTISLLTQKVYVVNSPALISLINRRHRLIDSNDFFLTVVFGKLFGFHGDNLAQLFRNPRQPGSLRRDTVVLEHGLLERGAAPLDEAFTLIMGAAADRLNNIAIMPMMTSDVARERGGSPQSMMTTTSLQGLLREVFTMSTAQGLFGPRNPFTKDPNLLDDFWQFESGIKGLTMGILPSITAAKPARARQRLVQAFMDYFENDYPANGAPCEFIRQVGEVARGYNRDVDYFGRYFFAIFAAFIINTVPVIFWTIGHIVENPVLLARIRAELAEVVVVRTTVDTDAGNNDDDDEQKKKKKLSVDVTAIRERCPLFTSTSTEVLRYVGASTSTLIVHEDVYIDDRYLLTKGALVQISATAVHSDTDVWGPDAAAFDPERFLKPSKVHPSAYRTFGGGSTLCPGRHLASDEILVFTAMFLLTFDVDFAANTPRLPRRDDTNMLSVTKPVEDLVLRLLRRRGMEKASWGVGK